MNFGAVSGFKYRAGSEVPKPNHHSATKKDGTNGKLFVPGGQ